MPTDVKADLTNALFALDSYNRGYGTGINGLDEVGQIGDWSIITTSTDELGQAAFAAGFYAIAYRDSETGQTVISYRGTDKNSPFGSAASDAVNGYGLALGNTQDNTYFISPLSLALGSTQSALAAQFYANVTQGSDSQAAAERTSAVHPVCAVRTICDQR